MNEKTGKKGCLCPFCDEELESEAVNICQACRVEIRRCAKCLVVVDKEAKVCPNCSQLLD